MLESCGHCHPCALGLSDRGEGLLPRHFLRPHRRRRHHHTLDRYSSIRLLPNHALHCAKFGRSFQYYRHTWILFADRYGYECAKN